MRKTRIFSSLILMVLISTTALSFARDYGMETRARNLVSRYFDALTEGDTKTVLTLIGGELLLGRQELLENPEYSNYLIKNYRNSTVSVINSRQVDANLVEVDTSIYKSPDEQFELQLLVKSMDETGEHLLIVSEQDAE
jgi:hypothetical protein